MAREKLAEKLQYVTTRKERGSYAFYVVGQNLFNLLIGSYLLLYLTDYRFIPPALIGVAFMFTKIWDAINDPLFGLLVDKSNLKSGKYIPWMRIGSVLLPIIAIITFVMPMNLSVNSKVVYAVITYIFFDVAYTVSDGPLRALVTSMTDNIKERSSIFTIGGAAQTIAALVLAMMIMPLVNALGWTRAILIFAGAGLVLMLPLCIFAKERYSVQQKANGESYTVHEILHYLIHNKYLLIFFGSMLIPGLFNTANSISSYIAKHLLGGEHMIGLFSITALVPVLLALPVIPIVLKRVDKFKFYVASNILYILSNLLMFFVGYQSVPVVMAMNCIRGFAMGLYGVLMGMFAADCVEYGHYKTGVRAAGITMALHTLSSKIIRAVGGAVTGFAMAYFQYDGALPMQSDFTKNGLWLSFTLIPMVGYAISLIFQMFYKLRDKDVQVMARCNKGEITREEAEAQLSRKY